MNERTTPETDAEHAQFAMGGFTLDFCRKLERERDRAREDATNYYAKIGELEQERDEAREALADWQNAAAHVEADHPDEKHCACVPVLRKLLADARSERDTLREAIIATLEENRHLADGDDCTLAKLKSVVPDWK